nr:MAG: nonstructural protein [Microvirus sp.]
MVLSNAQKQARHRAKVSNIVLELQNKVDRMLFKVYSVYDSKVEAYLPPLFMKSKGEFLRAFAETANDPKSGIGKYPSDYTAFELGTWDDATSKFSLHPTPISLGVAIEFVEQRAQAMKSHVPPDGVPITP